MLLAKLIEHNAAGGLRTDVLIGSNDVLRLVAADDCLFAVAVVDPLHTLLEGRHRERGFLVGLWRGVAPVEYGGVWGSGVVEGLGCSDDEELP